MTITSIIPGRIRVRDQSLTRADRAGQVRTNLLAMKGVTDVTIGLRTGSLLIIYSTALSSLQGIMEYLTGLFGVAEESDGSCGSSFRAADLLAPAAPLRRNAVNLGMLASLLTSMIGIMAGLKKLHYAAGAVFLAFFGTHIFERRRAMFA